MNGVIIIGAGHAGSRTAQYLREYGYSEEIMLFGEEGVPPYERPPLSKQILDGSKEIIDCYLHDQAYYESKNILLYLNNKICSVNFKKKEVFDKNNIKYNYDKLVFATGSTPNKINSKNIDGIFYLRTQKDSLEIKDYVKDKNDIAIIGAGFIGLEIASFIRQKYNDKNITIIDSYDKILRRNSNDLIRKKITKLHQENKIKFIFNSEIISVQGKNKIDEVILQDNYNIKSDMMIVGIGVKPNTALLEEENIDISNGIKVDEYCQTAINDAYAVGDVSCYKSLVLNRFIREESWNNAEKQPRILAQNIIGNKIPYNEIPWFWTDQFGHNFQILGQIESFNKVITREYGDHKSISFFLENNKIVGAFSLNNSKDLRIAKEIMLKKIYIENSVLQNINFNLKQIIKNNINE